MKTYLYITAAIGLTFAVYMLIGLWIISSSIHGI